MCFNSQVSILTYIIGTLACFNLWKQEHKIESLFFLWVIQMQFIEYLYWINPICNENNLLLTKIGIILNHTQPLILYILIYYYNKNNIPKWVHKLMVVFIIINLLYSYYIYNNSCLTVKHELSPHIYWPWNNVEKSYYFYILFIILIFILLIYIPNFNYEHYYSKSFILILILLFSYGISYNIYTGTKSVGAMWCFFACFIPLLLPIIYKLNNKL